MKPPPRWAVRRIVNGWDEYPFVWEVILWGGSGEHEMDGMTFALWSEAIEAATQAARNTWTTIALWTMPNPLEV